MSTYRVYYTKTVVEYMEIDTDGTPEAAKARALFTLGKEESVEVKILAVEWERAFDAQQDTD